jgi:hypothetical protein
LSFAECRTIEQQQPLAGFHPIAKIGIHSHDAPWNAWAKMGQSILIGQYLSTLRFQRDPDGVGPHSLRMKLRQHRTSFRQLDAAGLRQ